MTLENSAIFHVVESLHTETTAPPILPDETQRDIAYEITEIQVDNLLKTVNAGLEPLIQEVEATFPGHQFGRKKQTHMYYLAKQAAPLGKELGLDVSEIQILRAVMGLHDIGRHTELYLRLQTIRPGKRHGALGAWMLDQSGSLEAFLRPAQYAILFSIYWHSEKTVPEPNPGSYWEVLAYNICYALRDLDKVDIFHDDIYHEPPGITQQLLMHYLKDEQHLPLNLQQQLENNPEWEKQIANFVHSILTGVEWKDEGLPQGIVDTVRLIMTQGVSEKALSQFLQHTSIDVQEIKHSWATYVLYTLGMLFDINHPALLRRLIVGKEGHLKDYLAFLKKTEPKYSQIITALTSYANDKLGENVQPTLDLMT